MLECFVTYDLISQNLPWEECVRLTAWFKNRAEANEWIYARRKDPDWKLVGVGLPTELAGKYGMPYMHFHNTPLYYLPVEGGCMKCEIGQSVITQVSSFCSDVII
jgi:hypothetical protein